MYRYIIYVYRYTLLKSGNGQSVLVHLFRNFVVAKVYRYTINVYWYTCMRSAGMEQNCDSNVGAYLSIILDHEMTLERSIKGRGYVEKAGF